MYVELVGFEEASRVVEVFGGKVAQAAAGAALEEAQLEFEMTQELVPVDTEQLKRSGRVEPTEVEGSVIAASIAYGGPAGSGPTQTEDVDYAIAVHEDLEVFHPHGQAKYVETVVREEEASGRTAERMAAGIVARMVRSGAFTTKSGAFLRGGLSGRFQGSRR